MYGKLSDRSDFYSFGVVLLEILSGKKDLDSSVESPSGYLVKNWAWRLVKLGKTLNVIDSRIYEIRAERDGEVYFSGHFVCMLWWHLG